MRTLVESCPQGKLALAVPVACLLLFSQVRLSAQNLDCARQDLATLFTTVTDQNTRVPLAGALVTARWQADVERRTTARTDSTGRARICIPMRHAVVLRASYADIEAPQTPTFTQSGTIGTYVLEIDVPGALVRGRVIDQQSGDALPGVVVRLRHARMSALTDSAGQFRFERVPIGSYELRAEHIAYARNATALRVADDDLDALVPLTPAAIPLQPIVVTVFSRRLESVGFYERQKRGVGTFIDRQQIDAMNVQDASDLLRRIPGLRLVPQNQRNSGQPRNATVGRRAHCRYAFIVDGARTLQDFEMDFLAAPALEGIEVYNGLAGVPANFKAHWSSANDYSLCGVIAVWTRNSR